MRREQNTAPRLRVLPALALSLALLAVVVTASLAFGAGGVGPERALGALFGSGDDEAHFVVTGLRLPRTLAGIVVGSALGIAGAVLQTAARNPLAEPGLLGVSAGASFAVVVSIALGASAATLYAPVAIIGALLGCVFALGAARLRGVGDDPIRLVLAGVALSSMLGSVSSLVLLIDQRTRDEIRFWTIGALAGRNIPTIVTILPTVVLGIAIVLLLIRPLAALSLGDQVARSLGHRVRMTRIGAMLGVALLVGSATAVSGPIGFVGLVVPFAARALVGPDIRRVVPICAVLGPALILVADVLARMLVRPSEMPLGVVTAFVGAPVLVAVVRAQRLPAL